MKTKDLHQTVMFDNVTPHEVYEALMDSKKHAKFTGQPAQISREIGAECRAYDGWVEATNVELIPDEKIVQKWRGKDWPEGHYSMATFSFKAKDDGTELDFLQSAIPESEYDHITTGWKDNYWDPMKKMFSK